MRGARTGFEGIRERFPVPEERNTGGTRKNPFVRKLLDVHDGGIATMVAFVFRACFAIRNLAEKMTVSM